MAYHTLQDAIDLYGTTYVTVSCDRDGDGSVDTAAFEAMSDVVAAMINGYLLGRVPLPLAEVPKDLKKYSIDITIYELCPSQSVRTEEKTKRYDAAMSWLRAVKDNKIKLTVGGADAPAAATGAHLTAGPAVVPASTAVFEIESGSRDYTRDKLKGLL